MISVCRPTPAYPSNIWTKVGGNLPTNRFDLLNGNTKLQIRNLNPSDEGNYTCTVGSVPQSYVLKIEGKMR